METVSRQKQTGAYFTPSAVVRTLTRWAVSRGTDRLLDPSCGDGRFLGVHPRSVGVEQDPASAAIVHQRVPGALIHQGDFFAWASGTTERFECAAGNPPFIRYQRFTGPPRDAALALCEQHGARFSSLTSSWAPFLVATASLLKPGGRMAFVVPAEIGHAPYARPLVSYLAAHFERVQVVAVRDKLFPDLSEDCWLLYAAGYGGRTDSIKFTVLDEFREMARPPIAGTNIPVIELESWGGRLRTFLLSSSARELYRNRAAAAVRLSEVARVGIGYVTGANDFFHLRPSTAEQANIPAQLLRPAVRNGRSLGAKAVTPSTVAQWREQDQPMMLLDLAAAKTLPKSVLRYLDTPSGHEARTSFKCRSRDPWYVVPDVTVPDAFLSYMSGEGPSLVANRAACVGTNSVHVVHLNGRLTIQDVQRAWASPITRLSCEIEGHPLGGGMLKLEPREAGRIVLDRGDVCSPDEQAVVEDGLRQLRRWRHHDEERVPEMRVVEAS